MLPRHSFSELNSGLCRLRLRVREQLNRLGAGFSEQIRRVSNNNMQPQAFSSIAQVPIEIISNSNEDIGIEPSREYQKRIKAKKIILTAFRAHKNYLKNIEANEVDVKLLFAQNTDRYYFYNEGFIGYLPRRNSTLDSSFITKGKCKILVSLNDRYLKFKANNSDNKTDEENTKLNSKNRRLNHVNVTVLKSRKHVIPSYFISNSHLIIKRAGTELQRSIINHINVPPACFILMFNEIQEMSKKGVFILDLKPGNLTLHNNTVKRIDTDCIYPYDDCFTVINKRYHTLSFINDVKSATTTEKKEILLHNDMMRTMIIIMAEADLSYISKTGYSSSGHLTPIKSWIKNSPLKHLEHKIFPLLENPQSLEHKFELDLALELNMQAIN